MIRTFVATLRQARIDAELIAELGAGAFYWMADIAVQMTVLAQCAMRDVPTNVEAELGKSASAEEIIKSVVRV